MNVLLNLPLSMDCWCAYVILHRVLTDRFRYDGSAASQILSTLVMFQCVAATKKINCDLRLSQQPNFQLLYFVQWIFVQWIF